MEQKLNQFIICLDAIKEEGDKKVKLEEGVEGGDGTEGTSVGDEETPRPRRYGLRQKRVQKYSKFGEEFFIECQETELKVNLDKIEF